MMKFISFKLVFLIFGLYSAQTVKLPDEFELKERINTALGGGMHFTQKTTLAKDLANTDKEIDEIYGIVKKSLGQYKSYLIEHNVLQMLFLLPIQEPLILRAILQESPGSIMELERRGLLEKNPE